MSERKKIGDDCKWQFMGSECGTNLKCHRDLQVCTLENGRLDIQDIERQIVKKNKVAVEKLLKMNSKLANHDNRFASSLYHLQPIDIAAERPDNQEVIKLLIKYGANKNAQFPRPNTLYHAIYPNKNISNITALLEEKWIDAPSLLWSRYTALISPTCSEDVQIVIKLLDAGANPNISDDDGKTPLIKLAESEENEFTKGLAAILIKHGADPYLKDTTGKNALEYAEENGRVGLVQKIHELAPAAGGSRNKRRATKKINKKRKQKTQRRQTRRS
jgi:ankyrin repeat protein